MQSYMWAKPHHPAECPTCAPHQPGHPVCQHDGCEQLAEIQHRRHATAAEYDELPEHFKPIDGVAHQIVYTCFDHEVDPICGEDDHGLPADPDLYMVQSAGTYGADGLTTLRTVPTSCRKCGAGVDQPCTKANGRPRSAPHKTRGPATEAAPPTVCTHVHREECGGQDACQCRADDPAPDRQPRVVPPTAPPAPAPIHVPTHGEVSDFLAKNGIDTNQVISLELVPAATGPVVLRAVVAVLDHRGNHTFDQHGQRRAEVREIVLTPTHPTDPVEELPCRPVPVSTAVPSIGTAADATSASPRATES